MAFRVLYDPVSGKATNVGAELPSPPSFPEPARQEPLSPARAPLPTAAPADQSFAPPGKNYLKMRRSQRATMIAGNPVFMLDARVELSAEDYALVRKYKLFGEVVYDSKERQAHAANAEMHGKQGNVLTFLMPWMSVYKQARSLVSVARAHLSLRVTIGSLTKGEHIECKNLGELMEAEDAIREACARLRAFLTTAQTFDGRENIDEF